MLMQIVDVIPSELSETVDRLENWARWAAERTARHTAMSAEGKYRPRFGNNLSQEDSDELAKRGGTPPIDARDAQVVGRAIAPALGFPQRWYVLIKMMYFARVPRPIVCRRMYIHRDDFDREHAKALYAARNAIHRRDA